MKAPFLILVVINFFIAEISASEWSDNTNVAFDVSSRIDLDLKAEKTKTNLFAGIDLIKVFSNNKGDWGTLLLQPYYKRTYYRSDLVDSDITYRNMNFNYTGLLQHKLNFRIGHFEIPYGLEQTISTNGTVLDYSHRQNLGLKADWGISANGIISSFEYEFAVMQGSGNDLSNNGQTHVYSGRVGRSYNSVNLGLSAFSADLLAPMLPELATASVLSRNRYGVDIVWQTTWGNVLAEASIGKDNGKHIHNELIEFDWLSNEEELLLYLQLSHFSADDIITKRSQGNRIAIGARFEPDQRWQWDMQYLAGTSRQLEQADLKVFTVQLRYRLTM